MYPKSTFHKGEKSALLKQSSHIGPNLLYTSDIKVFSSLVYFMFQLMKRTFQAMKRMFQVMKRTFQVMEQRFYNSKKTSPP